MSLTSWQSWLEGFNFSEIDSLTGLRFQDYERTLDDLLKVEQLKFLKGSAMYSPGSTIPVSANFQTGGTEWSQPGGNGTPVIITYSFSNLLDGSLPLGASVLKDAIEEALNLWADYAPLYFFEVVDTGPLPNTFETDYLPYGHPHIRFGYHAIDGESNVLAHAYFPPSEGFPSGLAGDVHFDVSEPWSITPFQGVDLLEVAVHEIGHALGLDHEPNTLAIMNPFYAGRYAGLGSAFLFQDDVNGIQNLYGAGLGSVTPLRFGTVTIQRWATREGGFWDAQQWVAGDFNGDGLDDMAKAFNEFGLASLDVHLSTGASFTIQRWATQQGGFWDAQKWVAGDFNGDGRDDMAKAFNEFGLANLDVHLSTGSGFTIQRWATQQGGFWDAQQWVVGDFNGDGRDDMAKAFNDGGAASLDVHLSTGSNFVIQRWATRQGGFWDTQQWLVGDFNGDGRDDMAKAFNESGSASIDVHLSTGSGFTIQRWATRQGGFWDAQQWVVGDFNNDGRDDMAKAFNEGGLASIDVHFSKGSSFAIQRWATQQGGFWDAQKWLTGNFNGNGPDELSKAFTDSGFASIDVHIAI